MNFKAWKQSSDSDPDKKYYQDLMKKLFMVTGGLIFLKILFTSSTLDIRTTRHER